MAPASLLSRVPPAGGPAMTKEKTVEKTNQMPQAAQAPTAPTQSPATDLVVPNYPQEIYDEAHVNNEHRAFNLMLQQAQHVPEKVYVPPPVPSAVAERTKAEMEAGAQRVKEFGHIEAARKELAAVRQPEPWEGKTTPVFRPGEVDEYKSNFKSQAQATSKDAIAQPRR